MAEYLRQEPGTCPKCGMHLDVNITYEEKAKGGDAIRAVQVSPGGGENIGCHLCESNRLIGFKYCVHCGHKLN